MRPGGGPGGMIGRGPELSKVGSKRTRDWLIEHIKNPKAHNPQSRMPGYDGKINDADMQALADYLASLK
jgi:cbb3-type cytochrome oxidase cytochrome c subunit